jgi:hypothetical protein
VTRLTPLVVVISTGVANPWWAPLAAAAPWALWRLPERVVKWIYVRDRWQSPPP